MSSLVHKVDSRSENAMRAGARAFSLLLSAIKEISDATCGDGEGPDTRDYKAMSAAIETSLRRNVFSAGEDARNGYMRSLTDFLCISADGCGIPEDWDPLQTTEAAFASSKIGGVA